MVVLYERMKDTPKNTSYEHKMTKKCRKICTSFKKNLHIHTNKWYTHSAVFNILAMFMSSFLFVVPVLFRFFLKFLKHVFSPHKNHIFSLWPIYFFCDCYYVSRFCFICSLHSFITILN